ncbi:MAG: 30S ribosomal protein S19 [Planctomycetota bacterium]|nr:30S ribosomal protein S19 [Planctomycetota bacterium]
MGRSMKKGPYVDLKVLAKVMKQKQSGSRETIRTWARSCIIVPEFIGHNFAVHDGRKFIALFITEGMVGHKLGEFAITRSYHGHSK